MAEWTKISDRKPPVGSQVILFLDGEDLVFVARGVVDGIDTYEDTRDTFDVDGNDYWLTTDILPPMPVIKILGRAEGE